MGSSHVLNALTKEFWILKGKSAVKKALGLCYVCKYWKAAAGKQQMSPLSAHRVTRNPLFAACGTDLMGPLYVKIGSNVKGYVCIFNCFAKQAVHFEIVQSLEASAFIQAFRRFCNRRAARVRHVYSDNGGNFVLANEELNEVIRVWNSKKFQDTMLQERIAWHFSPPWHRIITVSQNGISEVFTRFCEPFPESQLWMSLIY